MQTVDFWERGEKVQLVRWGWEDGSWNILFVTSFGSYVLIYMYELYGDLREAEYPLSHMVMFILFVSVIVIFILLVCFICSFHFKVIFQCDVAFGPHSGTPAQCGQTVPPGPTTVRQSNLWNVVVISIKESSSVKEMWWKSTKHWKLSSGSWSPQPGLPRTRSCDSSGPVPLRTVIFGQGAKLGIHCEYSRYLECFNGVKTSVVCPYCNWYDTEKGECNQVVKASFLTFPLKNMIIAVLDIFCPILSLHRIISSFSPRL